jgi:hypothetical protein
LFRGFLRFLPAIHHFRFSKESFMSHIVQIQTELRDPVAIRSACDRLKLPRSTQGTFKMFSREAAGIGVELPGWRYPVVCDTASGQVRYDNYNGRWGEQAQLDRFLQAYAVEKAKIEARKRGHTVTEQSLTDGSIKLTVSVGGAA